MELAEPPVWTVLLGAGGTGGARRVLDPEALELLDTCPEEREEFCTLHNMHSKFSKIVA